jgi:hypothetical protein
MESPWASGPAEILQHAINLLSKDTDTNRRLAMILTDNAVEQMIKTYISLPKRITGIKLSRTRYQEISDNFAELLDALEENAPDRIVGIDLGAIEWYHRIRNELYHQGMGLTVERDKVDIYAELARILYKNLFRIDLPGRISDKAEVLGNFLQYWGQLERIILDKAENRSLLGMRPKGFYDAANLLYKLHDIKHIDYGNLIWLNDVRNKIVHAQEDYNDILNEAVMSTLSNLIKKWKTDKAEGSV